MEVQKRPQPQGRHHSFSPAHDLLSKAQVSPSARHFNHHSSARNQIADPGGNLKTAFKLPTSVGQRDFTNSVSAKDRDFYRLMLTKRRIIKATATNFSDNALSIVILGRQGSGALTEDRVVSTGQKSQLRQLELAPGTYYIRLEGSANAKSAYRLRLSIKGISNQNSGGGGFDGGGSDGGFTGDYDCGDFSSQSQAQGYLLPGDPYRLDGDGDGIACEELPF